CRNGGGRNGVCHAGGLTSTLCQSRLRRDSANPGSSVLWHCRARWPTATMHCSRLTVRSRKFSYGLVREVLRVTRTTFGTGFVWGATVLGRAVGLCCSGVGIDPVALGLPDVLSV